MICLDASQLFFATAAMYVDDWYIRLRKTGRYPIPVTVHGIEEGRATQGPRSSHPDDLTFPMINLFIHTGQGRPTINSLLLMNRTFFLDENGLRQSITQSLNFALKNLHKKRSEKICLSVYLQIGGLLIFLKFEILSKTLLPGYEGRGLLYLLKIISESGFTGLSVRFW